MPRKKKVLPDEIQLIVDEVKKKQQEEDTKEAKKLVDEYRIERSNDKTYWDITKDISVTVQTYGWYWTPWFNTYRGIRGNYYYFGWLNLQVTVGINKS